MTIDVCTTATLRPKIFKKTMESFWRNMLCDTECRLILNIDSIGEEGVCPKNIIDIATEFPFKRMHVNISITPGFTKAVIWCWNHISESDYVLHLEDDWELLRPVDINQMIDILNKNQNLASLKLSKENVKIDTQYNFVREEKLSLNPNLIKAEFLKEVVKRMSPDKNPEKQIRMNNQKMVSYIKKWDYGIYTGSGSKPLVYDTGRPWMKTTKYIKNTGFMNWEEK